jgi:peroxiredoxin
MWHGRWRATARVSGAAVAGGHRPAVSFGATRDFQPGPRRRRGFHRKEHTVTINVGDPLPDGTLQEFYENETAGCSVGPNSFKVADLVKGKKIVVFGLPGAFTPTCSAKHVPGYVANYEKLKAKGVDEIWCLSVNDAFVMGAWARDQNSAGKVRMMADGSAEYVRKLGLDLDLNARGMGVRSQRFAMVVDDGVVKALAVEAPGQFEVSGAEAVLAKL